MKELIDKLPEELRPLANRYLSALITMTEEELAVWVEAIIAGKGRQAYNQLTQRMTTSQLVDANKAVNKRLLDLNKIYYKRIEFQREMLRQALTIGLLIAKNKIL